MVAPGSGSTKVYVQIPDGFRLMSNHHKSVTRDDRWVILDGSNSIQMAHATDYVRSNTRGGSMSDAFVAYLPPRTHGSTAAMSIVSTGVAAAV